LNSMIQMAGGKYLDLENPNTGDIEFKDIASALSNITRFTGHVGFYSVAEHSVGVAAIARFFALRAGEDAVEAFRAGLMHDATEAYLGDVSSPLKRLLPEYRRLEERWANAVELKFGVSLRHPLVKAADLAMLEIERRRKFGIETSSQWPGFLPGYEITHEDLNSPNMSLMFPVGLGLNPWHARHLFTAAWEAPTHE